MMIDMEQAKLKAALLTVRAKLYLPFACTGSLDEEERAARLAAELDNPQSDASAVFLAVSCANFELFGMPKEPVVFCQGCGQMIQMKEIKCKECHR